MVYWGNISKIEKSGEKKHAFNLLINQLEEEPERMKEKLLNNAEIYKNTILLKIDIVKTTAKEGK